MERNVLLLEELAARANLKLSDLGLILLAVRRRDGSKSMSLQLCLRADSCPAPSLSTRNVSAFSRHTSVRRWARMQQNTRSSVSISSTTSRRSPKSRGSTSLPVEQSNGEKLGTSDIGQNRIHMDSTKNSSVPTSRASKRTSTSLRSSWRQLLPKSEK